MIVCQLLLRLHVSPLKNGNEIFLCSYLWGKVEQTLCPYRKHYEASRFLDSCTDSTDGVINVQRILMAKKKSTAARGQPEEVPLTVGLYSMRNYVHDSSVP